MQQQASRSYVKTATWASGQRSQRFDAQVRLAELAQQPPMPVLATGWKHEPLQDRLAAAMLILRTEFPTMITLAYVARRTGTNRTYLARLFRNELGRTLIEALTAIRMEVAVRHLTTTQDQICEIAWQVGYRSNAAFSRAFAARHGVSPREYRCRTRRDQNKTVSKNKNGSVASGVNAGDICGEYEAKCC